MNFDYFPEELIGEILIRSPVKTVIRCGCVCKRWFSLIKTSNFINNHLRKTALLPNYNGNNYIMFMPRQLNSNCFLRCDYKTPNDLITLIAPFTVGCFSIAGSCYGLVCVYSDYKIVLWNPLIRKSVLVPRSNIIEVKNPTFHMGFGFDSKNHDFKVLRIFGSCIWRDGPFRCEVYSLTSNSWKDITYLTPNYVFWDVGFWSVFVNGALHWVGKRRNGDGSLYVYSIVVFNVADEVFDEFPLPDFMPNRRDLTYSYRVKVFRESTIALLYPYDSDDIWVMKEYGVASSWVKLELVVERNWWKKAPNEWSFKCDEEALGKSLFISPVENVDYDIRNYVESMVLFDRGDDKYVQANGTNICI